MSCVRSPRAPLAERALAALALAAIAAGCAGDGCSFLATLPNGFPAGEPEPNAVQARVSQRGLAFIAAHGGAVLENLMPGGLSFEVPPSCGGSTEICCGASPGSCQIIVDVTEHTGDPPRLELAPLDPPGNRLDALLRLRARTPNASDPGGARPLPIRQSVLIGTVECDVYIDTEWAGADSLSVTTNIDFILDPATGNTTRIDVGAVTISDLDSGDIDLDGGAACTIVDVVKPLLMGMIRGQLEDQIKTTIEGLLCKPCTDAAQCAPYAACGEEGVCEVDDASGRRCVQELGLSGRLVGAALFGAVSPGMPGALDLYDVAGGYARTNANGISLGMLGGALPGDGRRDPCVPEAGRPQPPIGGVPESPRLQGNTRPDGQVFDFAIGIHGHYLDLVGWAAHQGGLLCLNVGTRTVPMLNTGTLSILMPSVYHLLHGQDAPVILAVRPTRPPGFKLGLGTFDPDGDIADPLVTLWVPELEVDFYTMIDEAWVRILTLRADVSLPFSLDVNEEGQLVPVLGDLENAFTSMSVKNSELLLENPDDIASAFPGLLAMVLPFLEDSLGGFALPAIAGITATVPEGGITSIDGKTILAIYGDLAVAPPTGKAPTRVETTAAIAALRVPATEHFRVGRLGRASRPAVDLTLGGAVAGEAAPPGALEWQTRVDGGFWSPWRRSALRTVTSDAFWIQGRHRLEIRARQVGRPETADPEPAALDVLIDTVAPRVTLIAEGRRVRVRATDGVSPEGRIRLEARFGDEAWRAIGAAPAELPFGGAQDPAALEVRATDEAGNVGVASGVQIGFHGRLPPGVPTDCGCRVGARTGGDLGAAGPALLLAGLVLGGLALRRRARRRIGALAALGAALALGAAPGCTCSGETPPVDQPDAAGPAVVKAGPIGRWSDVAARDGRVVVSAYDDDLGDLVFGEVSPADGSIVFRPIDGVPEGPVVLDPAGYRGGISAPGPDVGAWTSIALAAGEARIAYQDRDTGALRFAVESGGAWSSHAVDEDAAGGLLGLYASLALDASDVPGIAYMAYGLDDGAGGRTAQLRWVQALTSAPASPADWAAPEIVAELEIPCAGLCGEDLLCVASTNTCRPEGTGCGPCADGTGCVADACVPILELGPPDLPEGIGLFASAGWLPDGKPVIAHHDRVHGDLLLAVRQASGWQRVELDAEDDSDTGQWASLAITPDGTVWVAYQDAIDDSLLVISWRNGTVGRKELVDDGLRSGDRPHPVGWSAALVADATGQLTVAHQDSATADLLTARRVTEGIWDREELLVGPPGYGFFVRAAADGGQVWVSNYVYDRRIYPPGEMKVLTVP